MPLFLFYNLHMPKDYRQYSEYNSFLEKKGWRLEEVSNTFVLIHRLPLLGSVIKIKRGDSEISLSELDKLARRFAALFIKLELNLINDEPGVSPRLEALKKFGYQPSQWAFCPTKTIYIDLTLSLEELLAQTAKDVRRYLRQNQKKNFVFCQDKTLEDFYPLILEAGKSRGYLVPKIEDFKMQWGSFGRDMKVLLGYKDGELFGGSLTLCREEMAFGIHLAVSGEGLRQHFSYSLLWESIKIAKQAGCKILDLDGIYDPRYRAHSSWRGLTRFKKKFGGREVEFVGPFIKCRFLPLKIFARCGLL